MKTFQATHLLVDSEPVLFTEETAPDWLTSKDTTHGSTVDHRWFWKGHVLTLKIGESTESEYHKVTRLE